MVKFVANSHTTRAVFRLPPCHPLNWASSPAGLFLEEEAATERSSTCRQVRAFSGGPPGTAEAWRWATLAAVGCSTAPRASNAAARHYRHAGQLVMSTRS